jgi:deazaflavin-dependent oxidoreductase (nitroreductase family)
LFIWIGPRLIAPLDRWLYALTRGRLLSAGPPVLPVLLLTSTGRRSGKKHSCTLLYLRDHGSLVVVASNWGRRAHPAWSSNVLANGRATVQIGSRQWPVEARLATTDERKRLWPQLIALWPPWQQYVERSGRDVQILILTPAGVAH